jgi:hypothetical protein
MAKNYRNYYSRSVVLIGESQKGEILEPVFIESIEDAYDIFGGGELVESAREIINAGTEYIYLIRIDPENEYERYYDLINAYFVLESMGDVDVILPLGISLTDKIVEYPNIFNYKEEFSYNGDLMFETERIMESINYVKVKGEKTKFYSLRDSGVNGNFDAVILSREDFDLDRGDTITIDYNCIKNLEIEFEILKFLNGRIENSITLNKNINVDIKNSVLTEKKAKEFFYGDEEAVYVARCKNEAFNVYTQKDGEGLVYAEFDYQKYISDNTEYKYFVEKLAQIAELTNSVGVIKKSSKDYLTMSENILDIKAMLNEKRNYGKNVVAIASDCLCRINSSSYKTGYEKAFTGILGSFPSSISPTNKNSEIVVEVKDEFSNLEIKKLTEDGYTFAYNSIRNGIVPYKAVTLSETTEFKSLKNVRVVKEVQKRLKEITDVFIGRGNINIQSKLYSKSVELLDNLVIEGKIDDYSFKIVNATTSYIKTEVELKLINEVKTLKAGIVSGS